MTKNNKTRILFNCSTNIMGGGLKNAALFIKNAIKNNDFRWEFAISKPVEDLLKKWNIPTEHMHSFEKSPARSKSQRIRLRTLANELNTDMVYSMAGPVYVNFKQLHIMGISNPYYTHADAKGYFIGRNIFQKIYVVLLHIYILRFIRSADYFVFQTNESRLGFCKRYFVDKERTKVISNAIDSDFLEHFKDKTPRAFSTSKEIVIFCPAAAYPHKALHTIPKIAKELKMLAKSNYKFRFRITIDKNTQYFQKIFRLTEKFDVMDLLENIGPFSYHESIRLHEKADIVFVPSILETFSANYLEAMAAKVPLIVADKDFARDICGKAAVYINPFNAKTTARMIHDLISNANHQLDLIKEGVNVLSRFGDQKNRFKLLLSYLREVEHLKTLNH